MNSKTAIVGLENIWTKEDLGLEQAKEQIHFIIWSFGMAFSRVELPVMHILGRKCSLVPKVGNVPVNHVDGIIPAPTRKSTISPHNRISSRNPSLSPSYGGSQGLLLCLVELQEKTTVQYVHTHAYIHVCRYTIHNFTYYNIQHCPAVYQQMPFPVQHLIGLSFLGVTLENTPLHVLPIPLA